MKWDSKKLAAAIPVAIVAIFAGVVSYGHIETLALSVGQPLADARMLPGATDFLIVAGSVLLLNGSALGWLGVAPGIAATLFANIESGLPHGILSATVAAWPAVAFSLATYMLERWLHSQPEPLSDQPPTCGHTVAETPDENLVLAWLHERDCMNGKPSQRRYATTWDLSRPKVAELVGSLNGNGGHDAADT